MSVEFSGSGRALANVSLSVERGEIVGLVGETGSGKSTLAWAIMGLLPDHATIVDGQVVFAGRDLLTLGEREMSKIRGAKLGLVVQNARAHLNPLVTVGKQLENAYSAHNPGGRKAGSRKAFEMLEAVAMPDPVDKLSSYPHELSGGMAQRAVIALALLHRPELIVADEPTMGLDVTIQVQILDLLRDHVRALGCSCLLVTRDLGIIAQYCDRVGVMLAGELVEVCGVRELFSSARHPYSLALVRAASFDNGPELRISAPRTDDDESQTLGTGCIYNARCAFATADCLERKPKLAESSSDHWVRCHNEWEVPRWTRS